MLNTTKPDSEFNDSMSRTLVDRQRHQGDVLELLNTIENAREIKPAMIRRVIDLAHLFTTESMGRTLWNGSFPKFEQLLKQIKMQAGLDDKRLVGLCFAMALGKGQAIEALPAFVKNVPYERLKNIRFKLQHYLSGVHKNTMVP